MKKTLFSAILATSLSLLLISSTANSQAKSVDCDKGHSLQAAIDKSASSAGSHVVFVRGECEEIITILRDRLVIDGNNEATIKGTVRVFGARTTLRDLSITGPGTGILASTARVRLLGVHADGNFGHGLTIVDDAVVFHGAGSESNGSLSNNGGSGAYVEAATYAAGDVDISGNFNGIEAMIGTVSLDGITTISGNANHGIDANFHTSVLLKDSVNISNNAVTGVRLEFDSGLVTFGNVTISSNVDSDVFCTDTESSAELFGDVTGDVDCTDFNQVESAP